MRYQLIKHNCNVIYFLKNKYPSFTIFSENINIIFPAFSSKEHTVSIYFQNYKNEYEH